VRAAVAVVALFVAVSLHAAAWKLEVMGGRALGSAYASGAAFPGDASTVWFNPAGMMLLKDPSITATLPVIDLVINYHDAGTSTGLGGLPLSGATTKNGGTVVAVPDLYAVRPIGDRLALGIGFNTPFGLGTNYGRGWVGRYQAVQTQLVVYNLNPSAAFKINDQFSVGGGIDIQYATGKLSSAIDFGTIGASLGLPLAPQQHDGFVEIRGHDWSVGWNGGLLWHPSDRTRLGVAYRSNTSADLRGPAQFTVPPEASVLTSTGAFTNTRARASLPMPEAWSFGVVQSITPRVALLGDATRTRWSRQQQLSVTFENPVQPPIAQPSNWSDTWRFSLGAEFKASDRLTLRGGIADERTPVPDATREPRIPEANHRWYAVGATWTHSKRLDIDAFLVHLTTDAAPINVSAPLLGSLHGDARWNIWTMGVGGTWKF